MDPKVRLFLAERDRAYARGDTGVIRSLSADLRRWGVPDTATLANPSGKRQKGADGGRTRQTAPPKPKPAKCEHGSVVERCPECSPEAMVH